MSLLSESLHSLARSKLHLSTSSKDSCSLHRWVLLKNSIVNSLSSTPPPALPVTHNDSVDEDDDDEADEVLDSVEVVDSFMFPDAGKLVGETTEEAKASEAQWLDSLLQTLGDDDDDDFSVDSEQNISSLPTDDDEFPLYSPIVSSPMSSSDGHSSYYSTSSISVPYPVPYPPLSHAYHFDTTFEPLVSPFSAPYENPLPYHDLDHLEDMPEAIEDTSDDDSDAPTTPSLGRSSSSLTSVPLAERGSGLRHCDPCVYIDVDNRYFCFEMDPLPFPLTTSYDHYHC